MSWAAQRRFFILLIVGAVVVAFVAIVSIATFYKAPSCTDGVQNQNEAGIDCGNPCAYLCTAQELPPTVLFTKAFPASTGRTVVVASIENKNPTAAARDIPYSAILYGDKQTLIQEVSGTFDLPPGTTATIFIPGVMSGKQAVVRAFLNLDPSSIKWFTLISDPRIVPGVLNTIQSGSIDAPRVDATLVNTSVTTLTNVPVVALVRNINTDVIAASQTVVPSIPAQGQATATFTWNTAFSDEPASIEVVPIIPLP